MEVGFDKKKLNVGIEIPYLGYGTYKLTDESKVIKGIQTALEIGYRHIDTAEIYGNEAAIGKALEQLEVPREELFITSKVWDTNHGFEETKKAFEQSLEKLRTDYLDLYLIHWPSGGKRLETWRALEELLDEQRVRSIGVSNFTQTHLQELLDNSDRVPSINQVEFHPHLFQKELLEFCDQEGIVLEAYSPIARAKGFSESKVQELAEHYNKTPAQLYLRWGLQLGAVVIPKSEHPGRIEENARIFDFKLSDKHLLELSSMTTNFRINPDPINIP